MREKNIDYPDIRGRTIQNLKDKKGIIRRFYNSKGEIFEYSELGEKINILA